MHSEAFRAELTENILPYWLRYAPDETRGGFYGERDGGNVILPDSPRSSVLCSRILWTFSRAYRLLGDGTYLDMAYHAYTYLTGAMWDTEHGGVYTLVDSNGNPLSYEKRLFSQAFAIFALSEYHRATGHAQALNAARFLYTSIEARASDLAYGGYHETLDEAWTALPGGKSTDAHMHLIEAYTNLLAVWNGGKLQQRLDALTALMLDKTIQPDSGHMMLHFDQSWNSVSKEVSFGQNIENSWLLCAATDAAQEAALRLVLTVEKVDKGEGIPYGWTRENRLDTDRCWWVQAEAVLGYWNAHRITGQARYADMAEKVWRYINRYMMDRTYGEWYCRVDMYGKPLLTKPKISAWKCPYHNARMCMDMMQMLERVGT